nr:C39 family peptidase [Bacteroidota bacterium]
MKRIIIPILLLLLISCGPAIKFSKPYSSEVKLDVPFEPNLGRTCFSSSFAMVMRYYGKDVTVSDVFRVCGRAPFSGPHPRSKLSYWMKKNYGLRLVYIPSSNIEDLKMYINEGYPVVVLMNYSSFDKSGHNRVVTGYSDRKKVFITNDPSPFGPNYEISYDNFKKHWKFSMPPVHQQREAYLVIPIENN